MFSFISVAKSDCSARSTVFDFGDGFFSEQASFDWCKKRVQWWKLDTSDGWRDRYCQSAKYSKGGYQYWRGGFQHTFKQQFKGRNVTGIFQSFGKFYGDRVFRGFSSSIAFNFDSSCYGIEQTQDEWDLENLPEIFD